MKKLFGRFHKFFGVRRRLRRSVKVGLIIFLTIAAAYHLFTSNTVQRDVIYPFHYRDLIEKYSDKYHVDKYLAVAVMKNESNFVSSAISHSGAVGLMQLMPETADWIAAQLDEIPHSEHRRAFNVKKLYDPETNIRYGIWYLSTLENEFDGNDVLALAAYNAGRGNVWYWIEMWDWGADFDDIDQIPFGETRDYVQRVLKCRQRYQALYD